MEQSQIANRKSQISIVVPCRNERGHIEQFLSDLLHQDLDGMGYEILVADGGSDDGTREVIQRFAICHSKIRLIENPEKIVSTGLNRAIRAATGDFIIRMDVHTEYASDYILQCVETLRLKGVDNVGGPARTKGKSYLQRAICLAYHSPFSCGGVAFHNPDFEGYVDTVTYGCWRRALFERIGYFEEELVRNQDDEFNLRIIRAGGRIWQSPSICSWYKPRNSLKALFHQYNQYGYWKVKIFEKYGRTSSWRHVVPALFVGGLVVSGCLAPFSPWGGTVFLSLLVTYLGFLIAGAVWTCAQRERLKYFPLLPVVFAMFHLGYGTGFLLGIFDFLVLKRSGRNVFRRLSRPARGGVRSEE